MCINFIKNYIFKEIHLELKAKVRNISNSSKSFLIVHLKMESGDRILQYAVKKGIYCNGQLGNIR